MNLKKLQKNWEIFGKTDPLWAMLTDTKETFDYNKKK